MSMCLLARFRKEKITAVTREDSRHVREQDGQEAMGAIATWTKPNEGWVNCSVELSMLALLVQGNCCGDEKCSLCLPHGIPRQSVTTHHPARLKLPPQPVLTLPARHTFPTPDLLSDPLLSTLRPNHHCSARQSADGSSATTLLFGRLTELQGVC